MSPSANWGKQVDKLPEIKAMPKDTKGVEFKQLTDKDAAAKKNKKKKKVIKEGKE